MLRAGEWGPGRRQNVSKDELKADIEHTEVLQIFFFLEQVSRSNYTVGTYSQFKGQYMLEHECREMESQQ